MNGADRLAKAVRERRLARGGLTQAQAAAAAGVSDTTWNQVEAGKPVSDRSLAKIGQALWGDAMAPAGILEGGDPPDDAPVVDATQPELLRAVRDLTEAVRELREDMRRGRR